MTQVKILQDPETGYWNQLYREDRRVGRLRTHKPGDCALDECDVHNRPQRFHDLILLWRTDRGIMEQVCKCGIGHPSPGEHAFRKTVGQEHELIHGCCGKCCEEWYQ